jgi:hypothetical protein
MAAELFRGANKKRGGPCGETASRYSLGSAKVSGELPRVPSLRISAPPTGSASPIRVILLPCVLGRSAYAENGRLLDDLEPRTDRIVERPPKRQREAQVDPLAAVAPAEWMVSAQVAPPDRLHDPATAP